MSNCDLLGWFKEKYQLTKNKKDILKIKDVFEHFKCSDYFSNLTKNNKRQFNYKYICDYFENNIYTRSYYKDRTSSTINGKACEFRNILLGWIKNVEEEDENDTDELDQ